MVSGIQTTTGLMMMIWSCGNDGCASQVPLFTPIPLCMKAKSLGEPAKDQITHVQISPEATTPTILIEREGNFTRFVDPSTGIPQIPHSEFGTFWYHKKCRCFMCDKVRYTAYKKHAWNLPEADKKRLRVNSGRLEDITKEMTEEYIVGVLWTTP